MKKLITTLIVCLCCSVFGAMAQNSVYVDTAVPVSSELTNVRYEFVQSTQNNLHAFLLDKYSGRVWRYRIAKKEFVEIEVEDADAVDTTQVNYQLYMSAENNSMCFLLNVHTGNMWRYYSKDGERTFSKMAMPWNQQ